VSVKTPPLANVTDASVAPSKFVEAIVIVAAAVGAVVRATAIVPSLVSVAGRSASAQSVSAVKVTTDAVTVSWFEPVNETRTGATVAVPALFAALEGAADTRPKPNADTATSAMRLRSVFVDICFLSISQEQEFPALGFGRSSAFSYVMRGLLPPSFDESHVLIHQIPHRVSGRGEESYLVVHHLCCLRKHLCLSVI
jgi:hypothetical protein